MRVALCAGLLALVASVPAADAYVLAGSKWPRGRVTYYVAATQHATAIAAGVRTWNASGARVRFSRTRSRRRADVIVTYRGTEENTCKEGLATVGRVRRGRGRLYLPRLTAYNPYGQLVCLRTVVHELGHILGLAHENDVCATMNALGVNLAGFRCPRHPPWAWRCRLLEPDDVAGAVRRYGGRVAPARVPEECELYPAAPPVTELTGTFDPPNGVILTTFRHPATSPAPDWLRAAVAPEGGPPGAYVIIAARDTCPTAPSEVPFAYESPPGELEPHRVRVDSAGHWCIAVWHVDELGRPGAAASTVFVDVA